MNIIKRSLKKKKGKISTLECKWQWLPSWLLAINQSVAESTLPARLPGASAETMFTTRLFMSQTELPGQQ